MENNKNTSILNLFIILFACFLSSVSNAQLEKNDQQIVDSLILSLKNAPEDTNKASTYNKICFSILEINPDNAIYYGQKGLELSMRLNWKLGIAKIKNSLGNAYSLKQSFSIAIENYNQSLELFKELNDQAGIARVLGNIAIIYRYVGNMAKSLDYNLQSLKIYEEINDSISIARINGNIGIVYGIMKKDAMANLYFKKALEINIRIGDQRGTAREYGHLANLNLNSNNFDQCIYYNNKALEIWNSIGSFYNIALIYGNIGVAYLNKKEYSKALSYNSKALDLYNKIQDNEGICRTISTRGQILLEMAINIDKIDIDDSLNNKEKLLSKTNDCIQTSIVLSQKSGNLEDQLFAYNLAYNYYEYLNDFKSALASFKNIKTINDSLNSVEIQSKMGMLEEKRLTELKEKEIQIQKLELNRKENQKNGLYLGISLITLITIILFFSNRRKRNDNKIILSQKELVEEKQREILDSIEYALRIQTAILPPQKIVKHYLENSFILYKPKDIVAGDFYWMETVDDLILIAACDCTGHGVPGAMVSIVCYNALNRAVREFKLTQPAAILDKVAEIIIEYFSKSEKDIYDGMDISFCSINTKSKTIQWAGANNPIWLIQQGEFIETRGDRQPIGIYENSKPFTNHMFTLNSGDSIYLFSDGFADQFGGENGQKKLTKKRFKELILSIQEKPMSEQGIALDTFMTQYRNHVEQIDDILVMGVTV